LKPGQKRSHRLPDTDIRCLRICIRRMLRLRPWRRNTSGLVSAKRLIFLEARKPRKFIAHLDDPQSSSSKKKAKTAVAYYWVILVLRCLLGSELHVRVNPRLGDTSVLQVYECRTSHTGCQHDFISIVVCTIDCFDANTCYLFSSGIFASMASSDSSQLFVDCTVFVHRTPGVTERLLFTGKIH